MRLIAIGFDDDVLFKAVDSIIDANHSIILAMGEPSAEVQKRARDHNIVFETTIPYHRPKSIFEISSKYPPVSKDLIERLKHYESQYLSITDRISYFPSTVRLRKNTFFALCAIFSKRLKDLNPDLILFGSTPHMGWDVVIFALAKDLGIKTLILERTGLPDRLLYLKNYTISATIPEHYLDTHTTEQIRSTIEDDILAAITTEDAWVKFSKELNSAARGNPGWLKPSIKHLLKFFKTSLKQKNTIRYMSEVNEFSAMFFNNCSRLRANIEEFLYKRSRVNLYRYYDSISKPIPENVKYLYFPLHYQPERTTLPLAGDYFDHLLAASTIAHSLPEDTFLVIKEHPRQFDNIRLSLRTKNFRDPMDYDLLANLPKTILVSRTENSLKLINEAIAVVSLTGTSGWESLKEGVPVLCFGSPWYSISRACFHVSSVETSRAALKEAIKMSRDDVKKEMLRMVSFLQDKIFKGSNSARFAQFSSESSASLSGSLGIATVQAIEKDKYCL